MMVVCVVPESRWLIDSTYKETPKENQVYTVVNASLREGVLSYQLKEIAFDKNNDPIMWDSFGFIDIDDYRNSKMENELSELKSILQ